MRYFLFLLLIQGCCHSGAYDCIRVCELQGFYVRSWNSEAGYCVCEGVIEDGDKRVPI